MTAGLPRPRMLRRQRGVAVITALLLTALAITIVASLFWQQQVQVRSMENQRLHLQTKWILRGALDWARLILQQERNNPLTTLDGVWATPLAETRLDQYIERERAENENFDATLSGRITDAQARYNLGNLAANGALVSAEVKVFERLLQNLELNAGLASAVARAVAESQVIVGTGGGSGGTPGPQRTRREKEPIGMQRVEDLLAVPGFTQQAIERLRDFVIVLPAATGVPGAQTPPTKVNVNTAPPELLSALVQGMSVSEATTLAQTRTRTAFQSEANFGALANKSLMPGISVAVKSDYFLVLSRVRLDRAALDAQSLIQRGQAGQPTLLWIREH